MLNKVLFSPLEQFDFLYIKHLFFFDIANIHIYVFLIIVIFTLLLSTIYLNKVALKSNFIQRLFESIYGFILGMVNQQIGKEAFAFFPFFFVVFVFCLFSNLLGMLPFGFTITAHLSVTFFFAFSFNMGLIILGFQLHGLKFLKLFVPNGTPKVLLPLIVCIEVVSYLIRSFSLSIRLFANMMAGHCLLFVISSFVFGLVSSFGFLTIVPISLVYLAVFVLEFAIAFLQAYVFTILMIIYLNDSLHPGH
jgi:ATP synthase subunit 6